RADRPARDRPAAGGRPALGDPAGGLLQVDARQANLAPVAAPPPLRAGRRPGGEGRVPVLAVRGGLVRARPAPVRGPVNLRGKRATLLGLARTNVALARYLVSQGADVTISDQKAADQLA